MEHEGDSDTNCNWRTWNNLQRIGKGIRKRGNKRTVETIQTTVISRSARILRRVQADLNAVVYSLVEICCHTNSNEKPSANSGVNNSNNNNNNN